jgi:hypothetical protein
MSQAVLSEIEETISKLSKDQQLVLISRIAEKLRDKTSEDSHFEDELETMAQDEEIQNELREIERDFHSTELDGLD